MPLNPKSIPAITRIILILIAFTPRSSAQPRIDPFSPTSRPASAASPPRERLGVITSLELVNTEITSAFKIISDLTGWSIVLSPSLFTPQSPLNLRPRTAHPPSLPRPLRRRLPNPPLQFPHLRHQR